VNGARWDAAPDDPEIPEWYSETRHKEAASVVYICKAPATSNELQSIDASRLITMETEARLLGYPLCCVEDHYARRALMERAFWQMLNRVAKNNELEIRRLIEDDVAIDANPEEQALIQRAIRLTPAPYTSVQMCQGCAKAENSPAMRLSRKYKELAIYVDPPFAAEVQHYFLEQTPC
jgi:predicted DNA-binding ribbon-helix-helix protein